MVRKCDGALAGAVYIERCKYGSVRGLCKPTVVIQQGDTFLLALIGGSGLINGYIDCENPHVIKGRVIKEMKRFVNQKEGTVTETRINRMLFNILTPDGVKRLA